MEARVNRVFVEGHRQRRAGGLRRRLSLAGSSVVAWLVGVPGVAVAQVSGAPTSAGLPGAALASSVINWLMWLALMASLGAILIGAAKWRGGLSHGNTRSAEEGHNLVLGGVIGALLAGLAVTLVNTLFAAGKGG